MVVKYVLYSQFPVKYHLKRLLHGGMFIFARILVNSDSRLCNVSLSLG